ncbi:MULTISPECIES: hypothetical protein [Bacteroidales]|uniref:hypothetical protein n=1 Tax=Bacteroidales TaxID=171549 RepID=UPI0035A0FFE1
MANKQRNSERKGRIFIVHPTLERMLLSCDNRKSVAFKVNVDKSNFADSCKLKKDLHLSTYARCAAAFGKEVLVLQVPQGLIEKIVEVKPHISGRCYTIQEESLTQLLNELFDLEAMQLCKCVTDLFSEIKNVGKTTEMKLLLRHLAGALIKASEEYAE